MNHQFLALVVSVSIFLICTSKAHSSDEGQHVPIECEKLQTSDRILLIKAFKQSTLTIDRQPSQAKRKQLAMQMYEEVEPYITCIRLETDPHSKFKLAKILLGKLNAYTRFIYLSEMASIALDINKNEEASMYASELLKFARAFRQNMNYGNAIHNANIVLGHVALNHGNISDAKRFLIKASKTPGSEELSLNGPDTTLAKKLAEAGEIETVIQYLSLCKDFWKHENGRIDQWIASLQNNKLPF